MTATLAHSAPVAQEHHERLLRHAEKLPRLADLMDRGAEEEFSAALEEAITFLTDLLIPHMEAAERALYPELERMMQNRHSMTPARREHRAIRDAVDELIGLGEKAHRAPLALNDRVAMRRSIFRLYATLRIHLAEEMLYADIVEHGATLEAEQALAAAMEHSGTNTLG